MAIYSYNSTTGQLTTLASGQRMWVGTQAAHNAEEQANQLPLNAIIAIIDTGLFYRDESGEESSITMRTDVNNLTSEQMVELTNIING